MAAIFRWLSWGYAALPRVRRRFRWAIALALLVAVGAWLLLSTVELAVDWISWQTGSDNLYGGGSVAIIAMMTVLLSAAVLIDADRDAAIATALRALVRRAPEELVKPVPDLPAADVDTSIPAQGRWSGPFAWSNRGDVSTLATYGWLALILGLGGGAAGSLELTGTIPMLRSPVTLACAALCVVAGLLFTLDGVALIAAAWRLRRRSLWLEATAVGLAGWRFDVWPRRVTVPWDKANMFYGFKYATSLWSAEDSYVYCLEGDDAVVSWAVPPKTPLAVHQASDALCDLICARTGLPLLDASPALGVLGTIDDATLGKWSVRYGTPKVPHRAARVVPVLVALALVSFAVFALDLAIPALEPAYYNPMVQRAEAQTPLYQSALAQPDGAWLPPASGDGMAVYTAGAYQLTATHADAVTALLETTYGDTAVGVTLDHWPNGADGVAGLVVRDDQTQHEQVVFMMSGDTDGGSAFWQLVRMPDEPNADTGVTLVQGSTDAVRTGASPTNQLFVIVRGTQYLCYINGRFIGAGYDNTLHQGQPGLYVDQVAGPVSFSDFAVYPTVR